MFQYQAVSLVHILLDTMAAHPNTQVRQHEMSAMYLQPPSPEDHHQKVLEPKVNLIQHVLHVRHRVVLLKMWTP